MLTGKVALITGGARGIGRATAEVFIEQGAFVVVADVLEEQGTLTARELGDRARFVRHDVADEQSWAATVDVCLREFGRLDVLVNNAGIFELGFLEDTSVEQFERLVAVNQLGCFLGMRSVASAMSDGGGGSIVNLSSAAGLTGTPGYFAYGMTKWAVRGMTRTAAGELGRSGIRVNAILPGSIDTDMVQVEDTSDRRRFFATLPVARQGEAADIARAALFFASDASAYCTGTELSVDGGLSAGGPLPPRSETRRTEDD
jgi:3alpha(or 20beta)-hydroxysteroid dehydrogenase